MPHSYEEIKEVMIRALLKPVSTLGSGPVQQWVELKNEVGEVIGASRVQPNGIVFGGPSKLDREDAELLRDAFWDLFRQGYITLGVDDYNPAWPFFRLSYVGRQELGGIGRTRFHDGASFIRMLRERAPGISDETVMYATEATRSYYADCFLGSCVMLGVAAEAEFERLLADADAGLKHPGIFTKTLRERAIRSRITKFQEALQPLRAEMRAVKELEDLDTNLLGIQSIIRVTRNEAGHPSGAPAPTRNQVFINLHLFIEFARQLMALRRFLLEDEAGQGG